MPEVYDKNYEHKQTQTRQLGEKNPSSVITEQDAIELRVLYTKLERKEIIPLFSQYNERTIVSIISGQNWKHVPIYHKRQKRWTFPDKWSEIQIKNFKVDIERILDKYDIR